MKEIARTEPSLSGRGTINYDASGNMVSRTEPNFLSGSGRGTITTHYNQDKEMDNETKHTKNLSAGGGGGGGGIGDLIVALVIIGAIGGIGMGIYNGINSYFNKDSQQISLTIPEQRRPTQKQRQPVKEQVQYESSLPKYNQSFSLGNKIQQSRSRTVNPSYHYNSSGLETHVNPRFQDTEDKSQKTRKK